MVIVVATAIAACGGGGGDGPDDDGGPQPQNRSPVVGNVNYTATEDTDFNGTVSASDPDSDAVTFTKTSDPAHGTVVTFASNGAFTYRPQPNFSGSDSFSVRAADTAGNAVTATLTIGVSAVNDPPTIRDDVIRVAAGDTLDVNVLANDSDPDGDNLTISIEQQPTVGTASVVGGLVRLAMPSGFRGFTRFSYRATDSAGPGQVRNAVVFAGTEPFQMVYATNEERGDMNLYIDDLIARRAVNIIDGQRKRVGHYEAAPNGQGVVFDECVDTCGTGEIPRIGNIYMAPAEAGSAVRVVNHALAAGERILYRSVISPDGNWLAYATTDASAKVRLYVANLAVAGGATEVPLPANRSLSSDRFTSLTMGAGSLHVYFTLYVIPGGQEEIYRAELRNPSNVSRPTSSVNVGLAGTNADETAIVQSVFPSGQIYLERVDVANPSVATSISPVFSTAQQAQWHFSRDGRRLVFLQSNQAPASTTVWVGDLSGVDPPRSVATIPAMTPQYSVTDFHPGGNRILVAGSSGLYDVDLTQAEGPRQLSPVVAAQMYCNCARYDSTGDFVTYPGTPAGQPTGIWRAERSSPTNQSLVLAGIPFFDTELSSDGEAVATIEPATGTTGYWLFLRNTRSGTQPLQLTGVVTPSSSTFEVRFLRRPM